MIAYVNQVTGLVYYIIYEVVPDVQQELEQTVAYVLSTVHFHGDEVEAFADYLIYEAVPEIQREAGYVVEVYGDEVEAIGQGVYDYVIGLDPCNSLDCSPDVPNPGDYVNPGDLPGLGDIPDPCDTGICKFIDVSGVSMTTSTPSADQVENLMQELSSNILVNSSNGTSVHIYAEDGFAIGASCTGPLDCTLVKPSCETNPETEGLSCSIGGINKD